MPIVRSINDYDALSLNETAVNSALKSKEQASKNKKLNIPIGDCTVDLEYDSIVKPDFVLPTSYIRYTKKIGDDKDISIDYCIDDDDLEWLKTTYEKNREINPHATINNFETIINIFERQTGMARDPIPLNLVFASTIQELKMPNAVATKLTSDLYTYWINKRNKLAKPMCRRYWPQTAATDTNPYHVFRPRDKERYRLRKQTRKNDLESFRRLQQLRKEFGRAKILLQLVLEREMLTEAEAEIQKEIFEQSIYDINYSLDASGKAAPAEYEPRKEIAYSYKLKFPHLLKGEDRSAESLPAYSSSSGGGGNTNMKFKLVLNRKISENKVASGAFSGGAVDSARPRKVPVPSGPKRKKLVDGKDSGTLCEDERLQGVFKEAPSRVPAIIPGLPGPSSACRPQWPSFMEPLLTRDTGNPSLHRPLATYMDDLQMQWDGEEEEEEGELHVTYRARGRIGRGGRLVVDRVPLRVHKGGPGSVAYLRPSMLSISPRPGMAAAALPPVAPPVSNSFSAQARSREKDIFGHSDSEDERIELGSAARKRMRSLDDELKYHLNV